MIPLLPRWRYCYFSSAIQSSLPISLSIDHLPQVLSLSPSIMPPLPSTPRGRRSTSGHTFPLALPPVIRLWQARTPRGLIWRPGSVWDVLLKCNPYLSKPSDSPCEKNLWSISSTSGILTFLCSLAPSFHIRITWIMKRMDVSWMWFLLRIVHFQVKIGKKRKAHRWRMIMAQKETLIKSPWTISCLPHSMLDTTLLWRRP